MSQNTYNVRTRREQLATYPESVCVGRYSDGSWQLRRDGDDLDADRLVEGPVLYVRCDIAHQSQIDAEARGAAEERERCLAAVESVRLASDGWGDPVDDGDCERNEGIDLALEAIRSAAK